MRNLDFSHLYSNAVGFERMARELEGLFDQKTRPTPVQHRKAGITTATSSRLPWLVSIAMSWSWRPKNGTPQGEGAQGRHHGRAPVPPSGDRRAGLRARLQAEPARGSAGGQAGHGLLTIELARNCRRRSSPAPSPSANPISWHCPVKNIADH